VLKRFFRDNPDTNRSAAEAYSAELESLCRLAAVQTPCASYAFPTVTIRNDSQRVLGTVVRRPRHPDAAFPQHSPLNQTRCIWESLALAGVVHRDVSCKNTIISGGRITLLDFDAALLAHSSDHLQRLHDHSFMFRNKLYLGRRVDQTRYSRQPLTFSTFASQLDPCFQCRHRYSHCV